MNYFLSIIVFFGIFFAETKGVKAVPPPDFIFNIGSQLVQVFSVVTVFLSAVFLSASQLFKVYFNKWGHKKVIWIGSALMIVIVAVVSAFSYQNYAQDQAYKQWIAQSQKANSGIGSTENPLDRLKMETRAGENLADTSKSFELIPPKNAEEQFIKDYYNNIANKNFEAAYNVSKRTVSLDTFKSWYQNVKSIKIAKVQAIEDKKYSLELTLTDDKATENYAVLMTLGEENGHIKIADSQVRLLTNETETPVQIENNNSTQGVNSNSFFSQKKNLPISITNSEFQKVIDDEKDIFVLDAREDEEYEIGNFPNSNHIRFADLAAGEWIKIPTDRIVYVFCWSGMRGKEVTEFLRSKHIVARYIEKGANDWVAFGGQWNGSIKFSSKYGEERYSIVLSTDEVKKAQASNDVVIVDSRPQEKFEKHHIAGSINIPIIYTPSSKIAGVLGNIPDAARVITVCDDFISCFDAKVTGIKLEKLGHKFIGRYNKPWEY